MTMLTAQSRHAALGKRQHLMDGVLGIHVILCLAIQAQAS